MGRKAKMVVCKTVLGKIFTRTTNIVTTILFALILTANSSAQPVSNKVQLTDEQRNWIKDNPVVKATNNMDLVPFDFVREGQSMGFAISYLDLVANKVGLEIEYVNNESWDTLLGQIKRQEIDITHSLLQNAERDQFLNFTEPYLDIPVVNFGRKGAPRINSLEDLIGRKIGVIQGWAITDFYRNNHPEFTLVEYADIGGALTGLSGGEVDVVTGSLFTLEYFISQNFLSNIEVIGDDFIFNSNNVIKHRLASRKNLPILRDILQKGMDAVTSAEYKIISEKWRTDYKAKQTIAFTAEELQWIADHPTLRVTNKMEMAPLDFVRDGVPTGFSIDYLDLLARKTGLQVEYVNGLPWDELLVQLKEKKIDITHSLIETSERKEFLDFTSSYMNLPWAYFGHVGADPINSIDDLEGKRIGIVEGSIPWEIYSADYPHLNLIGYKSSIRALNDLSDGTIDVFPNLLPLTNYKITSNLIDNVEVIGMKFFPENSINGQMRLAVRKDWPILKSILQKGMNSVTEKEFSAISNKWYTQIQDNINIGLSEEERLWLSENNKIRVSVDADGTAPYEFINEKGVLSGISGELLEIVSKLLNVELVLLPNKNWSEMLAQLKSDESDLIATIANTEERQKDIIFSDSYDSQNNVIFAAKDALNLGTLESLSGLKIAQVKNDVKLEYIKATHPEIAIVEVETTEQALELLSKKEVDAYIGELNRTLHYLADEGITNISAVGETPFKSELSMGVRANLPLLASAVQKALKSIPEEEKRRITQKWMAVHIVPTVDYQLMLKILAAAALVIGLILYWTNRLHSEVNRRIVIEKELNIEQEKTLKVLEQNKTQLSELQFQRETIEKSAEAQVVLIEELSMMTDEFERKNKLLTEIMDNTGHGIVVFSSDLRLQAWNQTFKEIMGLEDREYEEGMALKLFFEMNEIEEITYERSIDEYITQLRERIESRVECNEFNWDRDRNHGVVINTVQRIMDDGTIINTYKDVTLERQEELRIKELALCDGLTGLANRRSFDVNMDQSIHHFTQFNTPFLLAYMDLDNFKAVNDTHGHNTGDQALLMVSEIIKKHVRSDDVPARLGGDEFAIIFNNTDDVEIAADRLEQIIAEIKEIRVIDGFDISIGASAGVTSCLDENISAVEMVKIADRALYQAKENGKGQIYRSHPTLDKMAG